MFKAKSQSNQIKKVNNFSDNNCSKNKIVASFFPSRESVKSAYPLKNIRNFTFLRKKLGKFNSIEIIGRSLQKHSATKSLVRTCFARLVYFYLCFDKRPDCLEKCSPFLVAG